MLSLSFRAEATGLPPDPDDTTPWIDGPLYELPSDLAKLKDVDVAVQTDPAIAGVFEDFMFDFDEGCWEQFGETSGSMTLSGVTVWQEAHTRWMGEYEIAEAQNAPYALAFEPSHPEAKMTFETPEWLLDAELQAPPYLPVWALDEDFVADDYPVTGSMLDTRYWDTSAADAFLGCVFQSYEAAAIAFAEATGLLVSVPPPGLPDEQTITACYADMYGAYGEPCLEVDEASCTNLDWHESWCGRRAYLAKGDSPDWACYTALDDAVNDYVAQTGATAEPLLVPETTYRLGATTEHPGLERAMGFKIPLGSDADYAEADSFSPSAAADPVQQAFEAADRTAWAADGAELHSCREYAYERYLDMSELDWAAKEHQRDERWIFDAAFHGRDGVGPFVTSLPTEADFRDSDGDRIWLDFGYFPDDGFVPWTRADRFASEEDRRRHRLFATYATAYPWDTRLSTFKNVYYYLHRLRKGPMQQFEGDCEAWKEDLRGHFTVNTAWHRRMDEISAQEGFLDEEMELMRDKQDALWEVYLGYLASDDPTEREQLTEQIDAALHEGWAAGCIPYDPSTPTPCDWAPSLFVEGLLEDLAYWRTHDYEECVAELGEAEFDDGDLEDKFVDLSGANAAIPAPWNTLIDDARAQALGRDYTASTGALRTYFIDMLGLGNAWGYRELVLEALDDLGDDALVRTSEFEKTLGSEYFGVSMQHLSTAQTGTNPENACATVPSADALDTVTLKLGPFDWEFAKAIENIHETGYPTGSPPPVDSNGDETHVADSDWGFSYDFWVGGELTYEPGWGTTLCGGTGTSAGWSVGTSYAMPLATVGYVTVKLRLGASGSASIDLALQACRTWVESSEQVPEATPEELAMNGGEPVCDDIIVDTFSFSVQPGTRVSGSVAVGASLAYIIELGVRGTLTLIDASLPVVYTSTKSNNNPAREPRHDSEWTVDLVLEMLSGSISLYFAIDAVVTTITIFELVLAKWHGFRVDIPLENDSIVDGNMCITAELALIGKTLAAFESDPCPCRLRPANCHD